MMLTRFGVKPCELADMPAAFVDELLIKLRADADEAEAQERKAKLAKHR